MTTQPRRTGSGSLPAALRIALLAGTILAASGIARAGPAEDADASAITIQQLIDAGKPADGETLAREAVAAAEKELGAEAAATANLYRLLGDTLFSQQRYADAEPWFRKAFAIREKRLGKEHLDTAQSATDLAITLKWLQHWDEAVQLYLDALAIRQKLLGPDHGDVARSWLRLGRLYDAKGDYAKAADTMAHAVEIGTKAFGSNDRTVILWTGERAVQLHDSGDIAAAEPLYRQAIAAAVATFAADDLDLAGFRQSLANLLRRADRPAEAEPLYRAALAAREKGLGPEDRRIAHTLDGLAQALDLLDRQSEAVPLFERALAIREKTDGPESVAVADTLSRLGMALMVLDRASEAAPLFQRTVPIHEKFDGVESSDVADALSRLGVALMTLDRATEAEAAFRRLLAIEEKIEGPEGPGVAEAARWLSHAAKRQYRDADAEIFQKRALEISAKVNGPEDLLTAFDLLSLGLLYSDQQRFKEAEPLLTRAVTIMEANTESRESASVARVALASLEFSLGDKRTAIALAERSLLEFTEILGAEDRDTVDVMITLAQMRLELGEHREAERLASAAHEILARKAPDSRANVRTLSLLGAVSIAQGRPIPAVAYYRTVLESLQQRYGADDPETRSALADLGRVEFLLRDYASAADYFERAVKLTEKVAAVDAAAAFANRTGKIEDEAIARGAVFDFLVKTYDRMTETRPAVRPTFAAKAFLVAQRVIESQAAAALSQMSARQAAGSGELAAVVRERQDLVDLWQSADRKLTALRSEPTAKRDAAKEQAVKTELDTADSRIQEIDARLAVEFPDFADLQSHGALSVDAVQAALAGNEVLLFYADTTRLGDIPAETYLWVVPKQGGTRWLRLARTTAELSGAVRELRSLMGVGPQSRGAQSLAAAEGEDRTGKVLKAAREIYRVLLAPVADMIEGKDLVVVASKKLSSLPFQLLVSAPPSDGADRYAEARWLIRDHAIIVLPSVAALSSTSQPVEVAATRKPYLGFANPLLTGRNGDDRRAFDQGDCASPQTAQALLLAGELPAVADLFRGAAVDVDAVRRLDPLPETADEACAVAASLGADGDAVRLGAAATEGAVKQLSDDGELAQARILHFATHGLVSGDLSGLAEPAIVLTPPDAATAQDDGLLTASEVTTLKLDADWVILSACNTAAGDGEALSGLARAFFYAGARSLMVSHWPVNSDAAVALATGAIRSLAADPAIGKAEALRRAMLAEIDKGGRHADPANWAPFILVGQSR